MPLQARRLNSNFNPSFRSGARNMLWSKETIDLSNGTLLSRSIKLKSKQTSFLHQIPLHCSTVISKPQTRVSNSKRLTDKKTTKKNKMFMQHITTQTIFQSLMQPSKPRCCRRSPTRHQRHARVKRPTKNLRTLLSPQCRWRECLNVEGMTIKWRGNRVGRKRVFPLKKNDW